MKRISKLHKMFVLLTCVGMLAGAAGPADAKKKKPPKAPKCAPFSPVEPDSNSGQTAEALEAPVMLVSSSATEAEPLVFEATHGPALWETATQTPIQEDTAFFNIQVVATGVPATLNIRQEWATPSASDFDLYIYDGAGANVITSGSANLPEPIGGPDTPIPGQETGAAGYESVLDFAVASCSGFTIESRAFQTLGEDVAVKVWLS